MTVIEKGSGAIFFEGAEVTLPENQRRISPALAVPLLLAALAMVDPGSVNAETPCPCGATHQVVSGDTLSKIARECQVTLPALKAANPMADPNKISPGQVFNIPGCGGAAAQTSVSVEQKPPATSQGTPSLTLPEALSDPLKKFKLSDLWQTKEQQQGLVAVLIFMGAVGIGLRKANSNPRGRN